MELADTSAWTLRHRDSATRTRFDEDLRRDRIATCDMVKLELLRGARDLHELRRRREQLDRLRQVPIGDRVWRRALDLLELLAERGPLHHREPSLPDLLIAAAAARAELPVLHYDRHFDVIAAATGQPVRSIAPLGSL
jgi:predicted nucleic acid-binding protein